MSATDLSQLNEIQIDYSSVEINTAGEYTAKASVEDINKNKTEKEFKVTVVQPSTDENTETTTEVQTDPTTGQKKTVVVSKPKNNTTTSNRNSSNKSNTSNSTNNSNSGSHGSSGSTSSKPSSSGNTGGSSSGSSGGNSSTPSQPSKVLKTTYWYECYVCGKHVESTVSLSDAKINLIIHLVLTNTKDLILDILAIIMVLVSIGNKITKGNQKIVFFYTERRN